MRTGELTHILSQALPDSITTPPYNPNQSRYPHLVTKPLVILPHQHIHRKQKHRCSHPASGARIRPYLMPNGFQATILILTQPHHIPSSPAAWATASLVERPNLELHPSKAKVFAMPAARHHWPLSSSLEKSHSILPATHLQPLKIEPTERSRFFPSASTPLKPAANGQSACSSRLISVPRIAIAIAMTTGC